MIRPPLLLPCLVAAAPLLAQLPPVHEHTLSNGMRVLVVERHDEPTIACGWVARVGAADERPGITGLAHLFEHMLFKGTRTIGTRNAQRDAELNAAQDRVQAEIRKELSQLRDLQRRGKIADFQDPKARTPRLTKLLAEFDGLVKEQRDLIVKDEIWTLYAGIGATGMNASTSQDMTQYIVQIPSHKLEYWAWLESDRLANPVFREFYSERNVVLEERKQTLESRPEGLVGEAFNAMTWMAHPYSWQVIGWPSDISQVTREQAADFFATYYAPNNITAILVGDLKAKEVFPLLERYFGRIPANPRGVPEVITQEPRHPAAQRMEAEIQGMPGVEIRFQTVAGVHQDAAALSALGSILGGAGQAPGRLEKLLVLDRKVALNASASQRGQKLAGTFSLRATPAPGHTPQELEPLLLAEVGRVAREGVTPAELDRVKNAQRMGLLRRMESNAGLRGLLTSAEASGTWRDLQEAQRAFEALTPADIQRVAGTYFQPSGRSVLVTQRTGSAQPRRRPQEAK